MATSFSLNPCADCARNQEAITAECEIPHRIPANLLRDALDRCHELRDIQQAYRALENFIAPEFDRPYEEVQANRGDLRALIGMLNAEAGRRIESAIEAVDVARDQGGA